MRKNAAAVLIALLASLLGYPATAAGAAPLPEPVESGHVESTYEAMSRALLALEQRDGADAALAELDRRQAADPAVAGICHAIAHDLGHAGLFAAGGSVAAALAYRDDVCGGGYTHGVIESALGESPHPARDMLRVCAPTQDGSCFHGVGHGLMFATGMDVDQSLRLCDRALTDVLSSRCGEGVFMQLFDADVSGAHATQAESATAMSGDIARRTCAATRQPYAANCWFYAPTVLLAEAPNDFSDAMTWCRSAPSRDGRMLCARGVGSRTIKYHPNDPRIGAAVCAAAGALGNSCLAGMGSYWSVHFKGERPPSDVCGRLGDTDLERRCLAVT